MAKSDGGRSGVVGRSGEIDELERALRSRRAELVCVYGRRRVGKTYLVREIVRPRVGLFFEVTGQNGGSMAVQLGHFQSALERVLYPGVRLPPLRSWENAFDLLATALEARSGRDRRPVAVFLDELPWLASPRSRLLSSLDHVWNARLSQLDNLVLIVCGSAASFMLDKIVNATGGLHNRVTRRIRLAPFSLAETEAFLRSRGLALGRRQVLEIYLALGGVPQYLDQVQLGRSAAQAIGAACFDRSGFLYDEFPRLFASLFRDAAAHQAIVRTLASRGSGLSRSELSRATRLPSGGTLQQKLRALEESDFVAGFVPYGRRTKDTTYRLVDEYTTFYLRWMERAPRGALAGGVDYWVKKSRTPSYRAAAGYAFEGACLKHARQIGDALGLASVAAEVSWWRHVPPPGSREEGAQVDLLFDRDDGVITLCELKYVAEPFKLAKAYAHALARKARVFAERTRTRKDVQIALVTTEAPAPSLWLEDVVDQVVTAEALFQP